MLIRLPARAAPLAGRAAVGLLVLTALALLLLACNGKGGRDADGTNTTNGNKDAEKILRQVVLQQADVPSGLQASDEQLTTNEQLIASSPDPKAARREVDEWGRILAFEATFQPEPDAPPDMAVQAISSSASLYGDAAGAGLSYAKAERSIDETDWKSQHPELQDFQQQIVKKGGLADELVWLRLSGVSPTLKGLVVEDLMIFRSGRVRGFLRVLSATTGEDRKVLLADVEGWLGKQLEHVKGALGS